ncbi:hypothetical protein HanXRQr2_Chr05g0207061 [Helianthus annuus]|uniref:Uncharacterized protein n=1 Tax=Helianthus annuus TaxID=4232 RepID=A0A251UNR7_HELAN|nr:hypothetical protein HanXRQr2_Chr05g0207061 [Helianthus annuus]KAJ0922124.1 hypothetical protein HanPSC8_Chr05g0199951 [Helianthus annuus]
MIIFIIHHSPPPPPPHLHYTTTAPPPPPLQQHLTIIKRVNDERKIHQMNKTVTIQNQEQTTSSVRPG